MPHLNNMEWTRPYRQQFDEYEKVDVNSSWFEVLKIDSSIYAICEPYDFQEVISFLIIGEEKALLWDTGMGIQPILPVIRALTDLPPTVVNSHSHYDHVGGNGEFSVVYGYSNLMEGDSFELGDSTWKVMYAPGHSMDSIVLYNEATKRVLMGDVIYPGVIYAQGNIELYAGTCRRLSEIFEDYTLLCSHNEPVRKGPFISEVAEALEAVISGQTKGQPDEEGLWIHKWKEVSVLTSITG